MDPTHRASQALRGAVGDPVGYQPVEKPARVENGVRLVQVGLSKMQAVSGIPLNFDRVEMSQPGLFSARLRFFNRLLCPYALMNSLG